MMIMHSAWHSAAVNVVVFPRRVSLVLVAVLFGISKYRIQDHCLY
jgi:hypothetical protein